MYQPPYPGIPMPPRPVPPPQLRPSGWWYLVGGLVILISLFGGGALAIGSAVWQVLDIDGYDRTSVPGETSVWIDETDTYTVYFEYEGASDNAGGFMAATVSVIGPDGRGVPVEKYTENETYMIGSREGRAEYTFEATRIGFYRVTGMGRAPATLAVAQGDPRGDKFIWFVVGVFGAIGGTVVGIVILIVVAVRRRSNKRKLMINAGVPRQ